MEWLAGLWRIWTTDRFIISFTYDMFPLSLLSTVYQYIFIPERRALSNLNGNVLKLGKYPRNRQGTPSGIFNFPANRLALPQSSPT